MMCYQDRAVLFDIGCSMHKDRRTDSHVMAECAAQRLQHDTSVVARLRKADCSMMVCHQKFWSVDSVSIDLGAAFAA